MKDLKKTALKIIELEKLIQSDKEHSTEHLHEMTDIINTLSVEDMLFIDEYIMKNEMLKD